MKAMALFFTLTLFTTPSFALQIYHLQGNQFAIICTDGTGYSFSGSANGAQEAGAILCNEHGGIANIQHTLSANQMLKSRQSAAGDTSGLPTGKRQHKSY